LEIARELARLRRVDLQRRRLNLQAEQQRWATPEEDETERLEKIEERQNRAKRWEWIRFRAASLQAEYLAGREDETLSARRQAEIEEFFSIYAGEIRDARAAEVQPIFGPFCCLVC
jgi:hypothetical protein